MDTASHAITRRSVGSREACFCDTLFDEATIARVAALLKTLQYRRVERSRMEAEISGGSAEIPEHIANSELLFGRMKAFAEEAFGVSSLQHMRLYVNSTVYGDMYYPHRDFGEDERHITALYYANPIWSTDWGGETILYSDSGDAQLVVTPRPGRVLAFHGAILHRGGVPARVCYEERLTIAYKLLVPTAAGGETKIASPRSFNEVVGEVMAALAADDVVSAGRLSEQSLAAGHVHPVFFNARAVRAEREGRDEDAFHFYLEARKLTPRDPQLLNTIGLCLTRLSRFQEAIYAFEEAIRFAPANAQLHHRLGLALGLAGRADLAERAHARACQLDPRNADALANLALFAARRGDEKIARTHAERALIVEPSNTTARAALALFQSAPDALPSSSH